MRTEFYWGKSQCYNMMSYCSECLSDAVLQQKKKDIPPQNPSTMAFFSLHRWGSTVVIQNVSQKFIFKKDKEVEDPYKKKFNLGRSRLSSKSYAQEQLFTNCQHLNKVLTVGVSSQESNSCWNRGARREKNTTERKHLASKQLPVVSLQNFSGWYSEHQKITWR